MSETRNAPGILGWRNPLVVSSRDIRAQHFAGASTAVNIAAGTTTTTSTYISIAGAYITLTTKKINIFIPFNLTVSHSAVSAKIFLGAFVYDESGSVLLGSSVAGNVTLEPIAGDWRLMHMTGNIDAESNNILPGRHLMTIQISNQTAGTLSWVQPNSNDSFGVFFQGTVRTQ